MAETARGKKFVKVHGYTRADGTKVQPHDRSTPDTSKGPPKKGPPPRARSKPGRGK
jgi:hypothetical protein